jgi:hypothetical protein
MTDNVPLIALLGSTRLSVISKELPSWERCQSE